ncbi:MAG: fibro-slime domain-containing protein [Fibrobacterales bacterium]
MNSTCITLILSLLVLLLSGCDLGIVDKKQSRSELIDEAASSEKSTLSSYSSSVNTSSETISTHLSSDQKNHTTPVTSSYSLHTSSYTTARVNHQGISSSNSHQAPTSDPYINPNSDTIIEICNDGIDNDMDRKIDCEDPDCWPIEGAQCGEFTEALSEALCRDGLDNDEDGKIDCYDPDCLLYDELCPSRLRTDIDVVAECDDTTFTFMRFEKFTMTVYDHNANTDFGVGGGKDSLRQGMVTDRLVDGRPVFKENLFNNTHIAEWWSESYAISSTDVVLPFAKMGPSTFLYNDPDFFPLDGYDAQEGDDGLNYYFAGHLQWKFVYDGHLDQFFSFSGNDDIFVYLNGNLVLDIGGVHTPIEGNFTFDVELDRLGIGVGEAVTLDLFMANRQKSGSQQAIEITKPCFFRD